MLPRYAFFSFLIALGSLTACSHPAVTETRYEAPAEPGARMCVSQCQEARDYCLKNCGLAQRQCTNGMQAQAIQDYETYVREQYLARKPLDLFPRDFERPEKCDTSSCKSKCERRHQSCYENCGGKVETNSSCVAFCF